MAGNIDTATTRHRDRNSKDMAERVLAEHPCKSCEQRPTYEDAQDEGHKGPHVAHRLEGDEGDQGS